MSPVHCANPTSPNLEALLSITAQLTNLVSGIIVECLL